MLFVCHVSLLGSPRGQRLLARISRTTRGEDKWRWIAANEGASRHAWCYYLNWKPTSFGVSAAAAAAANPAGGKQSDISPGTIGGDNLSKLIRIWYLLGWYSTGVEREQPTVWCFRFTRFYTKGALSLEIGLQRASGKLRSMANRVPVAPTLTLNTHTVLLKSSNIRKISIKYVISYMFDQNKRKS